MLRAIGNIKVSHLLDRELLQLRGDPTGTDESLV